MLNSTGFSVGVGEGSSCPSWVMVLFARALEALATLARADDYRSNQQSKKDPLQKERQKGSNVNEDAVGEQTIQQLKQTQMFETAVDSTGVTMDLSVNHEAGRRFALVLPKTQGQTQTASLNFNYCGLIDIY